MLIDERGSKKRMVEKKTEEFVVEAKQFFSFYKKEVGKSIREGKKAVYVDFNELASFSHEIAELLIQNPEEGLQILEVALEESGLLTNPRVRLFNVPEVYSEKVRNLRAKHLNKFVQVEGIVRQASEVRPQVINARFECPSCGTILSVLQIESKFHEPTRCSCGRKGGFKQVSKDMVDAQRIVIEESPESLIGGEQPRRLSVFLKEDLVEPRMEEKTTPGSRLRVVGILKEIPTPSRTGGILTRYDIAVEANNLIPLEETFEELDITEEDERQIKELSVDPKVMEKFTESIAPSIYGYEEIKQALILQLFGGVKKIRSDRTRSRGDIHVLLVGDPGVAKSVILKFISTVAPKGRYVVGRGATGAGITATVVKDEFLKGWSLEAGAMVLSHRGIVCLDEMDKMDQQDRSAMHEAMEQQCYLPDFEITLADNSKKKIGLFVDELMEKNKENVKNGINCEILTLKKEFKILTTDFESIYPIKINKVSKHIAPDKFIKISLTNGRELTVTPEHPCWIVKDGEVTTIPAKELKTGEFFPIPAELPLDGEEQTFDSKPYKNGRGLCKLLGYHITDGCYELNMGIKNGIQFWNNNKKLIEDYFNSVKEVFEITPIITKRGDQFAVRVISKNVVEFLKILDKNLLEKGKFKKIPEQIMKCKKEDLAFLLRALFDGDGTVVNVKRNGCRIGLISENKELAEQVSELLLRYGILSSVYKDGKLFRIDICGQENLFKFYESIGFLSEKKHNRLEAYLKKQKTFRSISDIIPNVTPAIKRIFNHLKINTERDLGNQICMDCNKHRLFLQKMISICEKKIEKLNDARKTINQTKNNKKIGEIRRSLEFSDRDIAMKLDITSYMLNQNEKKETDNENYQVILSKEIENMLSILPELRKLKKLAFGKIRWSRIKSLERVENKGIKWVYDIAIEPTHAFISNNMVLHNSVTISKATIQATLRAETSVLAAANPKFGRFNPYDTIANQIDIPPTLINRFDVIFILKDSPDRFKDEAIATHVLNEHQNPEVRTSIDRNLFRKYIAYTKQKVSPKLTQEAMDEIKKFYVDLRNAPVSTDQPTRPLPISARQLEALIRLSEANAKIRLGKKVTREDAIVAINLMKYYLMQVGYDYETKTFDIDRIVSGVSTSQRGKIMLMKDIISRLENRLGKSIPIEELKKELEGKMADKEVDDVLDKLNLAGDIFRPRKGFIQRM